MGVHNNRAFELGGRMRHGTETGTAHKKRTTFIRQQKTLSIGRRRVIL